MSIPGYETPELIEGHLRALREEKVAAESDIANAEEQEFEAGVEAGKARLAAVTAELKTFGDLAKPPAKRAAKR